MGKTKKELFALNDSLHKEADVMLEETGLGKLINEAGYKAVGSYAMQTMTWRDLDFERIENPPNWQKHWEFGLKVAQMGWVWKYSCVDAYNDQRNPEGDFGFYWGIQLDYPKRKHIWKIDLWTARAKEFQRMVPKRAEWASKMTNESRYHILKIKDAVWDSPEYRKSLISVHIYEAVLEQNIHSLTEFRKWWKQKYEK